MLDQRYSCMGNLGLKTNGCKSMRDDVFYNVTSFGIVAFAEINTDSKNGEGVREPRGGI